MLASPEPTYTTLGSDGATAIEPIEAVGWSSKTGFQSWPPFVDFQTPPEAVAAKYALQRVLVARGLAVVRARGKGSGEQGQAERRS
jgi:hypothetical protein